MPKAPPRRSERLKQRQPPGTNPVSSTFSAGGRVARGKRPEAIDMDSPPSAATEGGQDPPPNAAIRLAVQPRPGDIPFQLEVFFQCEASQLAAAPIRIHVKSPDRITFHRLSGQSSRDKRPLELNEQEQAPTKRPRHEPLPVQVSNGDDDTSCVQFEGEECQGSLADGYVVDLGLVKAFPSESYAEIPLEHCHDADQESRAETLPEGHTPQLRVMRISANIVIIFFIVAGLVIVFALTAFLSPEPPEPPGPPTGRQVSLQPVDWFQQAMWLEVGLISTARTTLIGEADQEPPGWACLPGLRPSDGPLHSSVNQPQPSAGSDWWSADTPFYPRYKPWDSTSDGIYVPETPFVLDVKRVLNRIFHDLETIAAHGPPSFRFQRGKSTQFRWSTSNGTFVPPHDTLPTLTFDWAEFMKPSSTVPGFPSSSPGGNPPSPTARPETIMEVFNLEPRIKELWDQLQPALIRLYFLSSTQNSEVVSFWPEEINGRALWMLFKLEVLGHNFTESNHDWGSDQCRIGCLHPKPTIDLAGPPSTMTPRMPRDTGIPSDVPMSFIEAVRKAQREKDRESQATTTQGECHDYIDWPTTNAAAAPCPPCPDLSTMSHEPHQLPRPDDWSAAQKTNNTAIELLNILNITVAQRFEGDDDNNKYTPKVHDLFKHRDIRVKACTLTRELVDYMQQVVQTLGPEFDQGTPASHPDAQWAHKKTREALTRLHDVAPFMAEVAVVRLCEMSSRAERGVAVMQETEQRLGQLRQEITKAIEDGWLAGDGENTTYLHFPSLTDIQQDWAATQAWLRAEADDVIDKQCHLV
ncbi:hypothetical protein BHE90_001060 [Fusarium euwallaceae]|uniref:Uncharacterized protein n=1 Tax=Fusarium euwallaceae TaxID=1147111 RepID=A0A430M919_9HYPO|nr:hypothetical protein BHE90_001060 [Fusarium euwallaceae]